MILKSRNNVWSQDTRRHGYILHGIFIKAKLIPTTRGNLATSSWYLMSFKSHKDLQQLRAKTSVLIPDKFVKRLYVLEYELHEDADINRN